MFKLRTTLLQQLSLLLGCVILSACASAGGSTQHTSTPLVERVVIQFKAPSTDPASRIAQLAKQYQLGMNYERELGGNFYVATLKPARSETELQPYLAQMAQEADIASIEADLMMQTMPAK